MWFGLTWLRARPLQEIKIKNNKMWFGLTWLRARPLQEKKIKNNHKKNVVRLDLVEGTTTSTNK
jgi:hypothetical protein